MEKGSLLAGCAAVRMLSTSPASSCIAASWGIPFPTSNLEAESKVLQNSPGFPGALLPPCSAPNLLSLLPPLAPALDNNVCVLMIPAGLGFALTHQDNVFFFYIKSRSISGLALMLRRARKDWPLMVSI